MKALLLDSVSSKIVSMVYSQTQILEQEVYLVEQLGKQHEAMSHLKAVVVIQPTEANADALIRELREPKFSEYHIFFTNIVSKDTLTRIGRADEHEVVRQVQEYYADFLAINEDFYHLGIDNSLSLSAPLSRTLESSQIFEKNVNGVLAALLSLKRKPSQIRYQAGSDLTRRLSTELASRIERDDIFEFRRNQEGPMLLILDRRDDPVTPLLTQWTYQAMVHELLGIKNNRVDLRRAPNVSKDLQEVVLSPTQDDFFAKHRYANFGDLGESVRDLLAAYQKSAKRNDNINSIQDMQAFLERYPAFRAESINVSKHVAIMSELARLTDACKLLDISQLEQDIACSNDHSGHKKELMEKIHNPKIENADKLRLTLLFLIRYESYDEARELKSKLAEKGLSSQHLAIIDAMLDYCGESKRSGGLFAGGGLMAKIGKTLTSSLLEEAPKNVYTQHQPVLSFTLEAIAKGKLKDSSFPVVMGNGSTRPNEVFIYFVGGATYEEATKVAEFNASNQGMKVILGGSSVQNSASFIKEILINFGK
jgi:vacuolar protein sorting-associated protein 45